MILKSLIKVLIVVLLLFLFAILFWIFSGEKEIDYNTQVKPILNKHCISCHGGVKQSGGLSFLFEEEAKSKTVSGVYGIAPGSPNKSEIIKRIESKIVGERMPFEKPPLSENEISILKKWIKQGAKWDIHWAYVPVKQVQATDKFQKEISFHKWANNDIDYFVYEQLVKHNLLPSAEADYPTLARRLSIDLIGLPPPLEEYQKLSKVPSAKNLDYYIDELLNSQHFGEKWAGMWLDLARYSDTKGYERDDVRTIWKYRDWLIYAFNNNKPYNQFLQEQIAGDLLHEASEDQLIATAFHRNTMTNDEGGTDNEEYRVAAVIDRVNTTWEVTMGTTFSCVQCHAHPFDPITHEDYFKFLAYFNNTRDEDTYDDYPVLREFGKEDSLKFEELKKWLEVNTDQTRSKEITKFLKTWQPSINSLTSDNFINSELSDTKWLVFRNNGSSRLKDVRLDGKSKLIYRYKSFTPGGIWRIHLDSLNGPILSEVKENYTRGNWAFNEIDFQSKEGTHDLYFTYTNPKLKNPQANGLLFDWFYFTEQFPGELKKGYTKSRDNFWHLLKEKALSTPIILENPVGMRRETRVFQRGNWLSPGKQVVPGVPDFMNSLPEKDKNNRLGLAQWMIDPQNPLVARTYVNRIWEQLFGFGIVETLEDFGTQGIAPTHQELLDHLSWKFIHEFKWSTKALLKYIVSSATYRQTAVCSSENLKIDARNKYYSRGPRIRLSAEQLRDQALIVSGLFSPKMYGASVMPYQPEGIWNSPYNGLKWVQSENEDQYRRAIYTYWKRTSPYPSMVLFDVMAREVCSSRRINTNTPLQALVTLNDGVFVEASLHFAKRMIDEGGNDVVDQLKYGYKQMMFKDISDDKLDVLIKLYSQIVEDEKEVKEINKSDSEWDKGLHLKALSIVANTMLNLDEFIMKN